MATARFRIRQHRSRMANLPFVQDAAKARCPLTLHKAPNTRPPCRMPAPSRIPGKTHDERL